MPLDETESESGVARLHSARRPRLFPSQVCFVVEDVPTAVENCSARFGWGPFQRFTAPVDDAEYRGWKGRKVTDVALGMAGRVQVELIHVHEGHDAIEAYQAEYGIGFQHLGVGCRSRDAALAHLENLGAKLHSQTEYGGVRIAFVDTPTGPALFELLEQAGSAARKADEPILGEPERARSRPNKPSTSPNEPAAPAESRNLFAIDRATIVTGDLSTTLPFYQEAFGWSEVAVETRTLRHPDGESPIKRVLGRAGTLELELLEPSQDGRDPYAAHLRRGAHGLVHAGGPEINPASETQSSPFEWIEDGEAFSLEAWAGGPGALQRRAQRAPSQT